MPAVPAFYRRVVDEHRERLARLAERGGVSRLKDLYEEAQGDLERKLARLARAGKGQAYTALHHRQVLGVVRTGLRDLEARLKDGLARASAEAQAEALRSLAGDLTRLEREFGGREIHLPLEESARFAGVVDQRKTSLLRMHEESLARYGEAVASRVERQLALSLVSGEQLGDATDRVSAVTGAEWWRAERIVRTEVAWAYNATTADAIQEASRDLPDLAMRWSEHVNDATGAALDKRVGEDSLALHGQVAQPGRPFVMPNDERVDAKWWGTTYEFPPNRPNDRAVLSPWRPHWGVPGWHCEGGHRVPATAASVPVAVPPSAPAPAPPAAPVPRHEPPRDQDAMGQKTRGWLHTRYGAEARVTRYVLDSKEVGTANGVRDWYGEIHFSKERSDAYRAMFARDEVGGEDLWALKTQLHEHLHALGSWKVPVPAGKPVLSYGFPRSYQTPIGRVLEEGAVELSAVTQVKGYAEDLGYKVVEDAKTPYRRWEKDAAGNHVLKAWHSYPDEVTYVETFCRVAAGEEVGPLGAEGQRVLEDVLHRWDPEQRPRKLAAAIVERGPRMAPLEEVEKLGYVEQYLDKAITVDTVVVDQWMSTLRDAKDIDEVRDVARLLGLKVTK